MINFLFGDRVLLWHARIGGYGEILRNLNRKPDVAIFGIGMRQSQWTAM